MRIFQIKYHRNGSWDSFYVVECLWEKKVLIVTFEVEENGKGIETIVDRNCRAVTKDDMSDKWDGAWIGREVETRLKYLIGKHKVKFFYDLQDMTVDKRGK